MASVLPDVIADAPSGGDDTAAIATKIAAAAASGSPFGSTLTLRGGIYLTNTGWDVPSNVRIVGQGKNGTCVRKTANCDMFRFNGASNASRCQRGGMADIRLDGGGFTGKLLTSKWADHMNFDRIWCYNNGACGTYLENVWDTYFTNVEWDTVSGIDGFNPSVLISSNSDDSSNIIVFDGCRWENFKDGALWVSTAPIVSAYTMVTGSNPPYGIYLTNCKMETPQLRGILHAMSADVSDVHMDGIYIAARGLYTGIVTGRTLFNLIGAYDLTFQTMKILVNGVTNPTVSDVFNVNTNARQIVIRDIQLDTQQNPSGAVLNVSGGSPDMVFENVEARSGQTPTMLAGTWPPQIASATALAIPKSPKLVVITGTTTVTSMTAQIPGRVVTLKFNGILTFTDGSNLKLNGNLVTAADTTITLTCDGTNWYEMSRSVN
jgi:hypothetical protein